MNTYLQDIRTKASCILAGALCFVGLGCMPVAEHEPAHTDPAEPKDIPVPPVTPRAVSVPNLMDDGIIALDEYRGQVVLLDFWATWSAPSRHELPQLAQLHREMQDRGVTVIGLCLDQGDPQEIRRRVESLNVPYPVGRAGEEVMHAFGGIRAAPTKVLLDRNGQIRQTYAGVEDIETIRNDIIALLAK